MLEGQRAFLSQEGHNQAQIPKTDYPGALHLDIRHQRQGSTVTSVKVDVPRLLGKSAHSASCSSRVWEKPHARFSLEPPPHSIEASVHTARYTQACTPCPGTSAATWAGGGTSKEPLAKHHVF